MAINLNETRFLVDQKWEDLDPIPDINALFRRFNERFFELRLSCVTVEWSKKMYTCAGICYYKKNRIGSAITIRLSEPLLKFRTRKNLVETLLHEMIHAFNFVKGIREGNGGHGPNFLKMMATINNMAGTNITVYHSFTDEVALYKKHVWRCNGICQQWSPFFGYVRRTMNRAPSASDTWFASHKQKCGGYFKKISPVDAPKEKQKRPVVRDKPKQSPLTNFGIEVLKAPLPVSEPINTKSIQEQVRERWRNRYIPSVHGAPAPKKLKPDGTWTELDSEVHILTPSVEVVLISSDEETDTEGIGVAPTGGQLKIGIDETRRRIRNEISDSDDDDEIVMIDNEFDSTQVPAGKKNDEDHNSSAVVKCPICNFPVLRVELCDHMDEGCFGFRKEVPFVGSSFAIK